MIEFQGMGMTFVASCTMVSMNQRVLSIIKIMHII